jgi:hypothetical protein
MTSRVITQANHALLLLIKIYSTHISAQKHANMLSICLIGFTYSPIHQSRHNLGFFRNYCAGGALKETGVGALRYGDPMKHISVGVNRSKVKVIGDNFVKTFRAQ